MKINWLATTAIVISLGAGSGVVFAQMPDSPQRHEHGAGGSNSSMSRPDVGHSDLGHSAAGEGRHLGGPSEHAARPEMRNDAEAAHQRGMGSAREQAAGQYQPHETTQTVGEGGERIGRGGHETPNAAHQDRAGENRAQENRTGGDTHQALQPNREQGRAAQMKQENRSAQAAKENAKENTKENSKSAETGRHGQQLGQEQTGRNEQRPQNLTGQNQQQRGHGAERAAKNHEQNKQAAQPSRSETPTAQQQGQHGTPGQTTGQARQHEDNGQAQTRENANQPQVREHTGQMQNQSNGRGQTASAKVNNQQRTQVVDRLRSDRDLEQARSNVDVSVNVGERLPERVRPRPLPSDIVNIVPEYRGYDYTVIHDEVAIVNPDTREVVDVIPERGITAEGGSYSEGGHIVLSQDQREILRRAAFGSATVGSTASSGATCLSLRPVPEELARSNPDLASDQYLAIGDQVVLVDPHSRKIVQVINF